ncbi:MAG: glycosyltransferase family 4 protein [Candidatus Cloacimonetes bacterium]|nr:glycosyltransferase family 4 protein [Candidatus Cloacimonadota bacterium]
MKKVLHIAQFLKYGSSTGIIAIIKQLKKRGVQSELLLSYPTKDQDHSILLIDSLRREGVRISFIDSTFDRKHWNLQNIQNRISKDYPSSKYNYITHGGFAANALSSLNIDFYHVCHGFGMNRPKHIDDQDFTGISQAKYVYAVSKDIIDQLTQLGIDRRLIHLMYYPLDIQRIKTPKVREIKILAVVGNLIPRKGQKYAIESLKLLLRTTSDLELLLFGDGEDYNSLKDLIEEEGLIDCVRLKGFCTVSEIFQQIDLLLVPSLSEGLGMVNLEAFLYGLPVVAFNSGGISEIIADDYTGLLAKRKDSKDLANKVSYYINNNQLAFQHANNGYYLSQDLFASDKNIEHLYQVLK